MANSASSNELHSITKHNNIVISGVGANEVLKFDGSNWINQTLAESGIAPVASPTFTTSITIGSASLTEAELEMLDGITAGTAAASKAVVLDSSTNITGIGTISSGAITATTSITLNARGELRFADSDSSNYVALESPATVGTSYTMTLPSDLPAADEVLTVTSYSSGAGVLEWAAAGGTTITNNADNYVITGSASANTLTAESTLTFAANVLTLSGSSRIDFQGGSLRSPSSTILDIYASTTHQIRMDTGNNPDTVTIQVANFHVAAGNVVIGTAGKGIDFSAQTQSSSPTTAEILDHYEEGTFTPALIADSTSATAGASTEKGFYTRIGHRVFYTVILTVNSLSGVNTSQGARIKGLPFSSSTVSEYSEGSAVRTFSGMSLSTAGHGVYAGVGGSSSIINLYINNETTGAAAMDVSRFTAGGHIELSGSYIAV